MESILARIIATLVAIVLLSWAVSIWILLALSLYGHQSPPEQKLTGFGDHLVDMLPIQLDRYLNLSTALDSPSNPKSPLSSVDYSESYRGQLSRTLTAIFFNTLQLIILAALLSLSIRTSLSPLRNVSREIAKRKGLDTTPISLKQVPAEIRPLLGSFNTLLSRMGKAIQVERNFITEAARELNAPLATLHAYTEIALRATTNEAKDSVLRKLMQVSRQSNRLAGQLLDLARLDAGINASAYQGTEMCDVVRHVVSEFRVQADARAMSVRTEYSPCLLHCDIDALGIMVRNLVDNAIRYGRDHGSIEVRCGYCLRADKLHPFLEVSDDGPGIPLHLRERMFERFHRVPELTSEGSGIGLSLVAGVARLHAATIEMCDTNNELGVCIRIVFPSNKSMSNN
ncbi:sensor histidine kinase [Xanthomonas arboricola]|uniref:histidine kinase n=4 Tax=Xanthomonas arboricola pv. pruni TaxID=69929 RepID=A0AAP4NGD7_9XANT|nr:ATP-binding protein [Xanthomonas arboricola]GAE48730.1 hypothetical protein XPU_0262 [Xanthomonas arboricola pv. pruni str. MAFF 311562]GAE54227.1 hypothetical protein XPR_0862 [Xanthomonas arboricola pv. pruni MAFF 301420]MDN0268419.1 ATP-binding protein [Xanthomonas arboricola pv. pruni]MDN0270400.1 ATP-binding protein [Xanthomonas arboricola pv. pruni]MDN0276816.1 ATP-binding protein [Xanthomonas arboricola pv. pruni]